MTKLLEILAFDIVEFTINEMAWYGDKIAQMIARPFVVLDKLLKHLVD